VFRAQTELVHEWRKFPFLDPDLPEEVLPARWPRAAAHAVFHERHESWSATAQEHFASLEALRVTAEETGHGRAAAIPAAGLGSGRAPGRRA
jgi:phenylacetic acid degradation operon negative regulatory protein